MKLSLNWIKRYVDLPKELTMEKFSHDLTMCTVEVEEVINIAEKLDGFVVGHILTVEPHPDADKLRICKVDIGDTTPSTIVCGGINLEPNQLTVVAVPGAMVRWHGEGEAVEIKPAKLRGVMSYGMICSSTEIGLEELFPTTQPAEIMDITSFDVKPGTPVADALNINDIIIDIDNKSLTNRPDLWGHYGMAREIAAIYDCQLKAIEKVDLPKTTDGLSVSIDAKSRCSRYAGLVVNNIENKPSPFAIQSLLWRVGIRPINLPVDITNYVMLATGQPTHGFDRSHIKGSIHVRTAFEGEKLELLDGEKLELTTEDLVIADEKAAIALAGIMGGKLDSILNETTDLIIEVANFNAMSVRRTAQRFDLRTEASSRFEKGIDPQRVDEALAVIVNMLNSEFPKAKISGYVDNYPVPLETVKVKVNLAFLYSRLGKKLSKPEIEKYLNLLGFKVSFQNDEMIVEAPSWRSTGDISLPEDILEEIARLMGYENFEYVEPTVLLGKAINQRSVDMERSIREYLAFRCGMQEIFTYPWIEDEYISAARVDTSKMLELTAPPAPDEKKLRSTLVPGLLKATFTNLRYYDSFRIFELTQIFKDKNYYSVNDSSELLPEMARHLGAAFVGNDARILFRQAKGIIEYMHRIVQMEKLSFAQTQKPIWAEEKLWLNIICNNEIIGEIGLVSPKVARDAGIKRSLTVIFEIDVEKLTPLGSRDNVFSHLPEYPLVNFDLSVTFDEIIKWSEIYEVVYKTGSVKDVRFIDEYRGSQIGEDKKSVTFRTWIGSDQGTLTADNIDAATKQIAKKLSKRLNGDIRGL